MILKKIFLLLVVVFPGYIQASIAPVLVRKCNTLQLRRSSFFEALEKVSRPGAKGDEAQVLAELCGSSSMPWKIMKWGAQRAALYPRRVRSGKFFRFFRFCSGCSRMCYR